MRMQESSDQRRTETVAALYGRLTISCILVFFTHFTLSLVPRFFFASSLLLQFALSVLVLLLVLGFGRWCKRLIGVYASAPAFVFSNILFIWLVYFLLVRQAIPDFIHFVFNGEVVMLLICLCSMLSSDPDFIAPGSFNTDKLDDIKAFEIEAQNEIIGLGEIIVISTLLFTLLQVMWQAFFMAWHVYCVCFNIKTDEWINWKKYPEFQIKIQSQPGRSFSTTSFTNPYDKGVIQNVKQFLTARY